MENKKRFIKEVIVTEYNKDFDEYYELFMLGYENVIYKPFHNVIVLRFYKDK